MENNLNKFSLTWNDFNSRVSRSLKSFRHNQELCDVTLVTEDEVLISAHKVIISACSDFFRELFKKVNHSSPLLYLSEINSKHLNYILDYVYNGEVKLLEDDVEMFIKSAEKLKIHGLRVNAVESSQSEENVKSKVGHVVSVETLTECVNVATKLENTVSKDDSNVDNEHKTTEDEVEVDVEMKKLLAEINDLTTIREDAETSADGTEENETADKRIKVSSREEYKEIAESLVHVMEDGLHSCKKCGYGTSVKARMMTHIEKHVEGLQYQCDICQKNYRSKNSLKVHKSLSHLQSIPRSDTEDVTGNMKTVDVNLENINFTEDKEEVEVTKTKDKAQKIKVSSIEEAQEKMETLIKGSGNNSQCALCDYTSNRSAVKRHIEIHFEGLVFQCEFCEQSFKTRNSLKVHKYMRHTEEMQMKREQK